MTGPALRCIVPLPRPVTRRLWLVLALTGAFMVVEAVGGWLSGALALLADAGHMLTDVGAIGLSLLTAWIARRPANDTKTYGYLRWEILAAFINGAALIGIAVWVVIEALQRMSAPHPIRSDLFIGVALLGLLVNAVSLALLHGTHQHSLNTRGAYLHVLSDLLGSVGAVAAAIIVALTGWTLADPIVSIVLSLMILAGAIHLVRESTDILLEAVPKNISLVEVEGTIRAVGGVSAVHDLHVWTVTSGMVAMSGHVVVPNLAAHPGVLTEIRGAMSRLGIGHTTIQLEVEDRCEGDAAEAAGHEHAGHRH